MSFPPNLVFKSKDGMYMAFRRAYLWLRKYDSPSLPLQHCICRDLHSQCIVALPVVPEFQNCKLQVAISFSIYYEDNFHTTHSKLHEMIPAL